jgi:chemotaxis protein CheX
VDPSENAPPPPRTIELPEALDLPAAASLAASFLKLVGEDLEIDARKVQRLGASCLQVLLSAARTWRAENTTLTLAHGSERFIDDLRLLGFTPETLLSGAQTQ